MNSLKIINEKEPWYKEGLCFECTQCGKCCSGSPGYVWLYDEEIERIAKYLKISREEFLKKYTVQVGSQYSLRDLKELNHSCIFLKDDQCSIYPVRPRQCKNYPFWPSIVKSKKTWEAEANHCEGIRENSCRVSKKEIEQKLENS